MIKLDSNYKVLMELGEKMVPGSDEKHFCQPTDVAVASNGHFFVADGYCNSRIMKFDETGKLLTSFGAPTSKIVFGLIRTDTLSLGLVGLF